MRIVRALFLVGTAVAVPILASAQVQLTELMPNPEGSDGDREWVEAVNSGGALSVTTGRSGWRLSDGDNHLLKGEKFTWQSNEVVLFVQDLGKFRAEHPAIGGRLIESSFSLKNSGGGVKLLNEQGAAIATASYGEGEEGYSFMNSSGSWTRGQKNGAPGTYPDTSAPPSSQPPPAVSSLATEQQSNVVMPAPQPPAQSKPVTVATPQTVAPVVQVAPTTQTEIAPTLLISEFLPNADGRDDSEFIELAITTSGEVKLDDVTVQVGEKKIKLTGAASGSFITLKKKDYRFSIRNKGETITLLWKDKPIHKISYSGVAPAGRSFARLADGRWVWTEPTPGAANVLIETASADRPEPAEPSELLPLTAQAKGSENTNRLPPTTLPTNFTPLLIGFASALLLSLAAVVFLK